MSDNKNGHYVETPSRSLENQPSALSAVAYNISRPSNLPLYFSKHEIGTQTVETKNCGAQLVLINDGLVAKIYDPLFYSYQNQEFLDLKVDVATAADSDYTIEASTYLALRGTSAEGTITARYYGSWTMDIVTNFQGEDLVRAVRFILVEYVPDVRMADIDPDSLTAEVREHIMIKVIEADYGLRRVGVQHDDLSPRNIILSDKAETIDTDIRTTLVDFGHSTVYNIRYGKPLRWEICNPLFTWASASAWSSMGWLPPYSEESMNKGWELWGDGRNGKYARVERNPEDPLGKPFRPQSKTRAVHNR